MKRLGILFVMGYALSAGAAQAATYHVSKAGSNSNSCAQAQSTGTTKLTIVGGLGCLSAGDTLLVRAGTYDERLTNNIPSGTSWSNKVRIAAYPGETVWLKPTTTNPLGTSIYLSQGQQYIEFDGINIDATVVDATVLLDNRPNQSPAVVAPNHIRMQNSEFKNHGSPGGGGAAISLGGSFHEMLNMTVHGTGGPYAFYISGDDNLIDGCDIYDVSFAGLQIYHGGSSPARNVVRNTKIHDLTVSEFFGVTDGRMYGLNVTGTDSEIYNNVIYNINYPYQGGNAGINLYTSSGTKIYNNTIYNNTTACVYLDGGAKTAVIRNNICYGNTGGGGGIIGSATTSNNLFTNPLFKDAGAGDFGLLSISSPAYNTGSTVTTATVNGLSVSTDKNGIVRLQSRAFDIGALQYIGQQAPPAAPSGLRIVSY